MGTEHVLPRPMRANARRWPRYKGLVYIRVITEKSSKEAIVLGRGTGLNEGGMALFGLVEMAVGQQATIEIPRELGEEPIRVRGIVKNRSCFTYGLEFLNENAGDDQNLRKFHSVLRDLRSRRAKTACD